ncbi:MAG: MFS transporter [Bryobacterales bacterium]|nr:MFS transporter [Bryobacterales bacterium]
MSSDNPQQRLTHLAMAAASFMLAHQVAAKAARDGLFLSRFPATDLPKIVGLAAIVAVIFSLVFSRVLSRFSPARLVPMAYLASSALHLAEYFLIGTYRDAMVYLVYLHIVGFGAILLSGFWSLASELFDPREAKLRFGRIAGMGTAGGIVGGLMAERTVALLSVDALLLVLAALHLGCGLMLAAMSQLTIPARSGSDEEDGWPAAKRAFAGAPFLLSLAFLVLLGTTSAALLDYLFKSGATNAFGRGPGLTRYFAIYYTGGQVLTFLVQSLLTPIALSKLGLGKSVMSLALAVAAGSSTALLLPLFPMVASVRAIELILRGSLFRSGYELFFTPIPARDKRAVKTVIDVGCDRLGDAIGAAAIQLILLYPLHARTEILGITIVLAALSVWITTRMDKAYLGVLENGLLTRAVELDINDVQDSTTMSAVLRTVSVAANVKDRPKTAYPRPTTVTVAGDAVVEAFTELRSGNPDRVRAALVKLKRWDPLLGPQVVRLLAWDEVSEAARETLTNAGHGVIGLLTDVLLDEKQDFAVRRRIPRIRARAGSQRGVDGLMEALGDAHFELRFQSSRALDYLKQTKPELYFDKEAIYEAVKRELSVATPIWQGRRLLDTRDVSDSGFSFLDDVLRDRANQSLENVFSLLAVVLPREPLKVAFRALHSEDRLLRGLGLEYLEGVLPSSVNSMLNEVLESTPPADPGNDPAEVLARLMQSNQSLLLEMKKQRPAETGD